MSFRLYENACHHDIPMITPPHTHPLVNLSRYVYNSPLPSLYTVQKNIPGRIIIVYDDDERVAPLVATTLVERKYENLFMLSGGRQATDHFWGVGGCSWWHCFIGCFFSVIYIAII